MSFRVDAEGPLRYGQAMTTILPATEDSIARAGALLRAGSLVAFPTETVYGLGADATSDGAVAGLYTAKARPRFNPLIAHVTDAEAAARQGMFGADAARLAARFWPGPLTLVVPVAAESTVCRLARAGLDSVALRVPAHPVAQAILQAAGRPIAAPSANRSGRMSPTTADHVKRSLDGRIDLVVDGDATAVGVESTIVACLGPPMLLRPGGLPREAIEEVLGCALKDAPQSDRPIAPGLLESHYAPDACLRLDAREVMGAEAVLDFGGRLALWRSGRPYVDLSPAGDLREAAARLFTALHDLDAAGAAVIAVASIPAHGLGAAIADRLARAAAPRG